MVAGSRLGIGWLVGAVAGDLYPSIEAFRNSFRVGRRGVRAGLFKLPNEDAGLDDTRFSTADVLAGIRRSGKRRLDLGRPIKGNVPFSPAARVPRRASNSRRVCAVTFLPWPTQILVERRLRHWAARNLGYAPLKISSIRRRSSVSSAVSDSDCGSSSSSCRRCSSGNNFSTSRFGSELQFHGLG